jgi:hyperosmotically inducible protein
MMRQSKKVHYPATLSASIVAALVLVAAPVYVAAAAGDAAQPTVGEKVEKKAKAVKARLSDSWVTAKTKIALFADDRVKGRQVNVDTNSGVVTLRGTVDSDAARSAAEEIARSTKGVKSVKNDLEVVAPSERKVAAASDKDINRQVQARLSEDARLKKVDPRTDAGVVTLKGDVPTITDSARASELAREVPGVRAVRNELNTNRESSIAR